MKNIGRDRKQITTVKENKSNRLSVSSWFLLAGLITFITYIRIRLLSTPFERDEGEYAYIGQLFLQGIPPYQAAFTMKLPGTSMMYAVFMLLFGQTVTAVHLGLLIVNCASIILLFFLARRWFNTFAGIISSVFFALATINPGVFGFAGHATHFVVFFALLGILILDISREKENPLWLISSGLSFGFAFLMKQPGLAFFLFAISMILYNKFLNTHEWKKTLRRLLLLLAGFLVPVFLLLGIIVLGGTFNRFWFWIVQYSSQYGSIMELKQGIPLLLQVLKTLWEDLRSYCILTCFGFLLLLFKRFQTTITVTLIIFLIFSIAAVLPGFYFRPHYFILMLPASSLLIGSVFYFIQKKAKQRIGWEIFLAVVFITAAVENIFTNYSYYFVNTPTKIVQELYWGNYFSESPALGEYIASHTSKNDRFAVLGSEPQLYFYANRQSASGHIYTYGMMEPQPYARTMQDEMIADIERNPLKFIIYYRSRFSWAAKPNSDTHIFRWLENYTKTYYHPICIAYPNDYFTLRFAWGDEIRRQDPRAEKLIMVYERNDLKP